MKPAETRKRVAERISALREWMETQELNGLIVTNRNHVRYLSGLSAHDIGLLLTPQRAVMVRPSELPELAVQLRVSRLAFEEADVSVKRHSRWQRRLACSKPPVELVAVRGRIEDLREVKDASEVDLIEAACKVTDSAFQSVARRLRPQLSEREAAWMFERELRERGAEDRAFDVTVLAGDRSSRAHARPTEEKLGRGRPIVVDLGAVVGGYCADMTRTLVLGGSDQTFRRVYGAVAQARSEVLAALRVGIPANALAALSRRSLQMAGIGGHTLHDLGHGVGLSVHERPYLAPSQDKPLREGHTFTIEPGLYVPGWGGVRLEDVVVLTKRGSRLLTQTSVDPVDAQLST
jgi:Xaa-Pro aminopeptidase